MEGRMTKFDSLTGHPMLDDEGYALYDDLSPEERRKQVNYLVDKFLPSPRSLAVTTTAVDSRKLALDAIEHADTATLHEIAAGTYVPQEAEAQAEAGSLDALLEDDEDDDRETSD
jgi:hypothetical protein